MTGSLVTVTVYCTTARRCQSYRPEWFRTRSRAFEHVTDGYSQCLVSYNVVVPLGITNCSFL